MSQIRTDIHPDRAEAGTKAHQGGPGWWPLDCLRSLGRAASVAAGMTVPDDCGPVKEHADYRGFAILTAGRDGAFQARITHRDGRAIRIGGQFKHQIDEARFASREEAVQHARFVIASGALNHLAGAGQTPAP